MSASVDRAVLDEQLAYYRARAPEYDEWFERVGRYDRGVAATAVWRDEVATVRTWLDALDLDGQHVLELAPGTGIWTGVLLDQGATVTAVDGAPEMLEALCARHGTNRLTTIEADLFGWTPTQTYDATVSCFFMSHVPDERFDAFLAMVASSLRAGATCFLLDGLREAASTAADHALPAIDGQTMVRRLNDGRTFTIVKRFRDDDELMTACRRAGLAVEVRRTPTYFQAVLGTHG